MHVLLVTKRPVINQISSSDQERLIRSGVTTEEHLRQARDQHCASIDSVRAALRHLRIRERRIDELRDEDSADIDLVISVGGDGTVLATNPLLVDQPIITVNSDPHRSVGHFTRCNAGTFPQFLDAFITGRHRIETIPRLCVRIEDEPHADQMLNDCLFTNQNPAAMSRYRIEIGEQQELQFSSGVWVATAAGSTGAIHSAGSETIEAHIDALLYRVREPFHERGPFRLLGGCQQPSREIRLTPAIPGMAIYIDGSHFCRSIPPGSSVVIQSSPHPLQVVRIAE